jgi:hypothetical protein
LALYQLHWSEGVVKQAVWLSGLLDFAQAAEVMEKVGQVPISTATVWRQANEWGEKLKHQAEVQQAIATALPSREQIVPGEAKLQQRMGASLDGAMVPVRTEGWKEVKIGSVFETQLRPAKDKETGEMVDLAHAVNTTYVAHLGGPREFAQALWAEARQRQWSRAVDTIVVADGAAWIWNIVEEHFYDSLQAVDWYHASDHLAQAASLVYGEGTPQAQIWRKENEKVLFEGQAEQITKRLEQLAKEKPKLADGLRREAGYFREHQRRMNYLELREDGYPIGSGTVESGCKQFKARFAAAGMRWNRDNLENLLPVRAAIMSQRFDQAWCSIYKPPLN